MSSSEKSRFKVYEDLKTEAHDPYHKYAENPQLQPGHLDLGLEGIPDSDTQYKEITRLIGKVHPFYLIALARTITLDTYPLRLNVGESSRGPFISCDTAEGDELVRITTLFELPTLKTDLDGVWLPNKIIREFDDFSAVTHLLGWTATWMAPFAAEIMSYFKAMVVFCGREKSEKFQHLGTYVHSSLGENSRIESIFLFNGYPISISARQPTGLSKARFDDTMALAYRAIQRAGVVDVPVMVQLAGLRRSLHVYDQKDIQRLSADGEVGANMLPLLRMDFQNNRLPPHERYGGGGWSDLAMIANGGMGVTSKIVQAMMEVIEKKPEDWYYKVNEHPNIQVLSDGDYRRTRLFMYQESTHSQYEITIVEKK